MIALAPFCHSSSHTSHNNTETQISKHPISHLGITQHRLFSPAPTIPFLMISYEIYSSRAPFHFLKFSTWRQTNTRFLIFLPSKTRMIFFPCIACSHESFSLPTSKQLRYGPPEELFGLDVELKPSNGGSQTSEPRSWFGPNGQYIRELPCPSCRGRGYTPCTECGIERSRPDCPKCSGKGIVTCHQCSGARVTWEESIDERPWERARSISPLKVKEDDEVDNLDIELEVKKKSKRIYQSPPPEVGLKISRSLKDLNAKTGLFSKRMKIIHRDPMLHAQRVAAIKKSKGTDAARKRTSETMKGFFSNPENRRKRNIAMKGVNFFCQNCGREGHRRHYCPELKDSLVDRRFTCRLCGGKGHNRRTCSKLRIVHRNGMPVKLYRCKVCRQYGHNRRACPQLVATPKTSASPRPYKCRLCHRNGHNIRTCPNTKAINITQHAQD